MTLSKIVIWLETAIFQHQSGNFNGYDTFNVFANKFADSVVRNFIITLEKLSIILYCLLIYPFCYIKLKSSGFSKHNV